MPPPACAASAHINKTAVSSDIAGDLKCTGYERSGSSSGGTRQAVDARLGAYSEGLGVIEKTKNDVGGRSMLGPGNQCL